MSEEIYKNCINDYEISNFGNCRRLLKNGSYIIVNGSINNKGYRYFQIKRSNKRYNHLFHHLVATQFISIRPDGLVIDHIDRNRTNNHVSNLRYITHLENCRNSDRVIQEIPFDENRHFALCKKYRDDHKEEFKITRKKYYETNKEQISQKDKNKGNIPVECSICKNIRNVSYSQFCAIKRQDGGISCNKCRVCSSLINLTLTKV